MTHGSVGRPEISLEAAAPGGAPGRTESPPRAAGGADDATLAWAAIAVIGPAAIVAMLVLAEPLGELIAPRPLDFFADPLVIGNLVRPEHPELVRVAIAILAVLAVAAVVAYAPRSLACGRAVQALRPLRAIGPPAVLALLIVAWLTRSEPSAQGVREPDYFSWVAGVAALAFAAACLWLTAGRVPGRWEWSARATTALRRWPVAGALAVAATVIFLLPAVFTDESLPGAVPFILNGHVGGIFADFVAVGNGRTPGVDFAAQYSSLLPYALAPVYALTDYSPGWFTIVSTFLSAVALVGLWRALAQVTRDELAAVALYLPLLAVAVVPLVVDGDQRLSNASQYQLLPERYLLPCLLAWLLARHLRGSAPRRTEPLLLLAAVGAFNNPEFGLPCFVAVFGALALHARTRSGSARGLAPLAFRAGLAIVAVGAAICLLDLIRTGSLPEPDVLLYYSRLFGSQGFGMIPMPVLGFHLAVYVTFAGALIVAAVRAREDGPDRPLTAMLAFAGLLGILACVYYAGRSNAYSLIGLFPLWGFTLALLTWLVLGRMRSAPAAGPAAARRMGALGIAVLVGFGLMVTTLIHVPAPWSQVQRIAAHPRSTPANPNPFELDAVEDFIAAQTRAGEPVVMIGPNGFMIARDLGITNVSPIAESVHIVSGDQVQEILDALAAEGGETVFTRSGLLRLTLGSIQAYLRAVGFEPVARDPVTATIAWRASAPDRALR